MAVTLPNSNSIFSETKGQLPLSAKLSPKAKEAIVLPKLQSSSLISLGQLCDDNCNVHLDKKELKVYKEKELVMKGYRNPVDGLWDIPIVTKLQQDNCIMPQIHPSMCIAKKQPVQTMVEHKLKKRRKPNITYTPYPLQNEECLDQQPKCHAINVILRKKQTKIDLAKYHHATCMSPTLTTFSKAIATNNFITWPGLTPKLVLRNLPKSIYTYQGHLHSEKQGLQSTKKQTKQEELTDIQDFFPPSESPNHRTNEVCYAIIDLEKELGFMDLTGKFPRKSSRGNEYLLIGYNYDANHIRAIPIKNRKGPTITEAWKQLHRDFKKAGAAPKTYVLDNEKSKDLLDSFEAENIAYQLVPPYKHRNNQAERAIQTFKNHFKSCLASVDPNFPLSEWDRLIPQVNITLNLLRNARVNPKLSAYTYIYGQFNFMTTPMAPPGTKVVAHVSPQKRATWELNGEVGWYVGPSMDHYRCVQCYFPRTREVRNCDTVEFFPHDIVFPRVTLKDHLKQAADDLITILTQPPKNNVPSMQAGDPTRNAILQIAKLLKRVEHIPEPVEEIIHQDDASAPRVKPKPMPNESCNLPRTPTAMPHNVDEVTTDALQQHSNLPKNVRFQNQGNHKHNLRSNAPALILDHMFHPKHSANHLCREDGKKETIDSLLAGKSTKTWSKSLSNEWGRLSRGNDYGVKGTETIDFIYKHQVPPENKVTYASCVCDYRPLKDEPCRVRITVGGDKLDYHGDAGSPTANLLETKIIINSTISDAHRGARFMCADIKDHFLATPMQNPECMRVKCKHIPQDIRLKYNLAKKVTADGYIYTKIQKGMPGLKQAAILAYQHLKSCLEPFGYEPIEGTVGLWHHKTRPTKFCLCVDDFGIKYWSKSDAEHLFNAIRKNFRFTVDYEGNNYCGLTLKWNYPLGHVDTSMPKSIPEILKKLNHASPSRPQHSPHKHAPIQYGEKGSRQWIQEDNSLLLPQNMIKPIQSTTGSLLYYARALDNTMLPALNEIAATQAKPTQRTQEECTQLLDYAATYPQVCVRFHASDMVLRIDSDAAYLVMPEARSRIAGYFQLNDDPERVPQPTINGAIIVECKTLKHVVSSAAEAETAGVFYNAQKAIPIRCVLEKLGHHQPPTPLKTDNSTALGFVHNNIHQKRSKSWDMRFHWLRDRMTRNQINVCWEKGVNNDADYFTKHHPATYHQHTRQTRKYVRDKYLSCLT